jgi:hypothetical protein
MAALALALALPAAAAAQQDEAGTLSGSVLDAARATPIAGARVSLLPDGPGVLPDPEDPSFLQGARVTVSGEDGNYRFTGLPPGRYRLHVSRVGYRAGTLGVELRGAADSRVSVSLTVQPITLAPVQARGHTPDPFGRARAGQDEVEEGRLAAERLRREAFVSTDVRALTHADVVEAVTLGESDLFRAVQRLPGVATRDDYTAELWTRGAAWDQTRVYFDGVPLFNPLHGVGAFSGVSPNAVGAAFLHPGVLPTGQGGGAAGVLDLRTRRAAGEGEVNGLVDLSLVSTALALDQRVLDGRGGWMLSGRRTYLDWLTAGVERAFGWNDVRVPYSFSDLAGRADLRMGGAALEASGLMERDRITDDVPDIIHRTTATWGNTAGRITLAAPFRGWDTRHTVSVSRYSARVTPLPVEEPHGESPSERPSRNRVAQLAVEGQAQRGGWSGGWLFARQTADYRGPSPIPNPRPDDRARFASGRALPFAAAWAERRWEPLPDLTVQAGLRLEGGAAVRNGGSLRPAPRLTARWRATEDVTFSAGVGRGWQYSQAVLPAGLSVGSFQATYLWLLAGDEVPAIRADVATAGVEAWFGDGWIADANLYLRRATGVAVPHPEPGFVSGAPLFAEAENRAYGVETSVRRIVGRWTASAGYTWARSELRAGGYTYPAPEDRTHTLDATTLARVSRNLRVGAAFTAASGASFTRRYLGWIVADEHGDFVDNYFRGLPGEGRTRAYASLDLLLDWSRAFRGWELGAYLQLRNVLGRDNPARYNVSIPCEQFGTSACAPRTGAQDQFQPGLPTLPLIGFRARF